MHIPILLGISLGLGTHSMSRVAYLLRTPKWWQGGVSNPTADDLMHAHEGSVHVMTGNDHCGS
jgi:hypothetical protein